MHPVSGSVLLSGFDLVGRIGLDPAADRLLRNLVMYAASRAAHEAHPQVTEPIRWGDYVSECGVVSGPLQGLVVNAEWVAPPTDPGAVPLHQSQGEWNTRPSDQFVPGGRRLLGPFGYSTGCSLKDLSPESPIGSGVFWVSVPAGKNTVVSKVRNPEKDAGELAVSVGRSDGAAVKPAVPVVVAPGQTVIIRTPIPDGDGGVSVRYTGSKTVVLVETSFE